MQQPTINCAAGPDRLLCIRTARGRGRGCGRRRRTGRTVNLERAHREEPIRLRQAIEKRAQALGVTGKLQLKWIGLIQRLRIVANWDRQLILARGAGFNLGAANVNDLFDVTVNQKTAELLDDEKLLGQKREQCFAILGLGRGLSAGKIGVIPAEAVGEIVDSLDAIGRGFRPEPGHLVAHQLGKVDVALQVRHLDRLADGTILKLLVQLLELLAFLFDGLDVFWGRRRRLVAEAGQLLLLVIKCGGNLLFLGGCLMREPDDDR